MEGVCRMFRTNLQTKKGSIISFLFIKIILVGDFLNSTGIIRKIDELGRIVLPKELRQFLNINPGDDFEVILESKNIVLKKYVKLMDKKEKITKILESFNDNISFKIYVVIDNEIINFNEEKISLNIVNIIKERKKYIDESNSIKKISENCLTEDKLVVLPLISNSDLLGAIISSGKESISVMEEISRIIADLIYKNNV